MRPTSGKSSSVANDPQVEDAEDRGHEPVDRDRDLLTRRPSQGVEPKTGIRAYLADLFNDIEKGFHDQSERSDDIQDYWDCYNCVANSHRYYNGIADIYFPLIHDAVEARVTRFSNQMFPQGGRYVQAVDADGSERLALVSLMDHYVRRVRMKTQIVMPLLRNGDIEGQYNLYVDWAELERQIVSRETRGPRDPETGMEMPGDDIEDMREEDIIEGFPVFEVLHDPDVLVLPQTADSVEEALSAGGSATIVRRWSKAKLKRMAKAGNIRQDEADWLIEEMGKAGPSIKDTEAHILQSIGVRKGGKEVQVWETWAMLPLGPDGRFSKDGRRRLCRIFFGPQRSVLGVKRNPYWNDRCPLLSCPVQKMAGNFKGPSLIRFVADMQYEANDAVNEGADAATFSAMPLVARDPEKADGPMVFGQGAIWDIPPDAVQLLTFPDLTPRAQIRVQMAGAQIFQTLGVNPSMLPQQTRASKPNQAMVAQEQAVDLLTTATAVSIIEEGVLTPAIEWAVDLDYQYRDRELVVRSYGEEGKRAAMQAVPPLQNRNGLAFVWRGGEQVRQNAMFAQQGAQMLNVMISPPLQQVLAAAGKKFDPTVIIEMMVSNAFGPEVAQRCLVDQREQLTNPPDLEDEWMLAGMEAMVHPLDDDNRHIQEHSRTIMETGDPTGLLAQHRAMHVQQAQAKQQAVMMAQLRQQMAGQPGQGGPPQLAGPGRMGQRPTPPGAMPMAGRPVKAPNGAVHMDQMMRAGGIGMPRKT